MAKSSGALGTAWPLYDRTELIWVNYLDAINSILNDSQASTGSAGSLDWEYFARQT